MQHKSGEVEGFTKRYRINRLVYYETFKYIGNAIAREKEIKGWSQAKKLALIKSMNPTWQDFAKGWGKPIALLTPRVAPSVGEDTLGPDSQEEIANLPKRQHE